MLIFDVFPGCFLDGFGSGVGVVLGDILVPKRRSKAKGSICGNACFTYVILVFPGVVGSIWGARKREKQSANPICIPTQFCDDFGAILGIILRAKIVKILMWNCILVRAEKETLSQRNGETILGVRP